ncbi:Gar1/Naf1 RNA binding region-domain-containing protein [Absidia repens]|uniref:H/ACA ribonucleoprotein complex subunit n=1 Tax=Absidia repens TaxID=90262 RepID=A0A1X2I866_9FUNG|nr:Gar1/Naf1 RNA binding region-domain-containing protein [Absidia repens]
MDPPANNDHPAVPADTDTNMTANTTSITNTTNTTIQDPLDNALADPKAHDYDSSDLELSSDEDSSSSDEDNTRDAQQDSDADDDDDENDQGGQTVPKSKNEVTDITIETPTVKVIPDSMRIDSIGTIVNVMDKTVVVQQHMGCNTVLDMGSLLVFEQDRYVLGEVFETFGPVESPFYSVRFNTVDEIDHERTVKGAAIGYVPSYERTQLVQVEQLKLIKGTDASNQYDEEVGADELEFSDDEKEMEYRRKSKKKVSFHFF